ncbi:MAG: hypothetical protein J6I83_00090 [Firmicutes bacterium]|nr:hypothetical protein [Bacillota bacterium]
MFPNAYNGVKKIYLAEILGLIAAVIGGIAGIAAAVGILAKEAGEQGSGYDAAVFGGGVVVIIAGILLLISFILNVLGISKASQDEPNFKKAMIWLIISLIGSFALGMTNEGSAINIAANFVYQAADVLVTFFVINGLISLAEKLGRSDLAARGTKLKNLIIGIYVIALVVSLISAFMANSETMETIAGVLACAALIIMIIAYFMYLKLLSRARNMLA